jgi:hypothetical protein
MQSMLLPITAMTASDDYVHIVVTAMTAVPTPVREGVRV